MPVPWTWAVAVPAATAAPPMIPVPAKPYPGGSPETYQVRKQGVTAVAPYIAPDGVVRAKIAKTSRETISFGAITLAVKGRPGA